MNGYELSRQWFDYCFENPEKIKPKHTAIYFFAIEHCNRLGWKKKFGFPSQMAMEAVGIKNWRTYSKAFTDLVEWGFFELIEKSQNQYSSNIIALVKNTKPTTKSLDKALSNHGKNHIQNQGTKQGRSTVSINKQTNNRTKNNTNTIARADEQVEIPAWEEFWKYAQTKFYHEDFARHIYDDLMSSGWRDHLDRVIRNWRSYLNKQQKYQRKWLKGNEQTKTTNRNDAGQSDASGSIYEDDILSR